MKRTISQKKLTSQSDETGMKHGKAKKTARRKKLVASDNDKENNCKDKFTLASSKQLKQTTKNPRSLLPA